MFRPSQVFGGALGVLLPLCANAFYLPGASPHNYAQGEKVNLFVNALTPMLSGHDDSKLVRDLDIEGR
jgi:transmembrane 9 superfamily member 2/4